MIIQITNDPQQGYRADLKDSSGILTVGTGKTKEEAVAVLFFRLLHEGIDWIRHVNLTQFKIEDATLPTYEV